MDAVAVVADDARQAGLAQFPQLIASEANGRLVSLVPEAISTPQVIERFSQNARECLAHPTSRDAWAFEYSANEEVHVADEPSIDGFQRRQVFKGDVSIGGKGEGRQASPDPEGVVSRQAVAPATLDVDGNKVAPARSVRTPLAEMIFQDGVGKEPIENQ